MWDENQVIQVKWNNTNKNWYESKGYVFTKRHDILDVYAKDLSSKSDARVKAVCDYCGEEYDTCFFILIKGRQIVQKDCCSHCVGKKASDVSRKKRANKYIGLAKDVCEKYGYVLLTTVDDYIDLKMNINFICPKHGKQTMMLESLLHEHKCRNCSYEERGNNMKYNIKYIKEYVGSINGNILLNPNDYKDVVTHNLKILCSCGNIFVTSFANYMRYNVNKCRSCVCRESSGEKKIREYLELHNIEFEQEKRFKDCRDKRSLPFDFYLPTYNLIIEFDGQHHYEENTFANHKITKEHDKIKNQYCQSHNIDLLRIPYWQGSHIEDIIANKLNL